MELLADRDPEEARAILDPVLERMMEAVRRYEGTVNQHAMALAAEIRLRPLIAHCQLGLGTLHRHTGKRPASRDHFIVETMMYTEMGMRFWLEQADAEAMEL